MENNATNRTHSQKRVKDLRHQSDVIGETFNTNNFYQGKQINMIKLKEQISIAKKKLLEDKDEDVKYLNQFSTEKEIIQPYANLALIQERTRRIVTRADIDRVKMNNPDSIKRLATELGDYKISKRNTQFKEIKDRKSDKNENFGLKKINGECASNGSKHQRFSSVDPPSARNTLSINSVEIQYQKLILRDQDQVREFESKIILLWELYESIVELMQEASKSVSVNEKLVLNYIKKVTSRDFEFVHYLSEVLGDSRIERSIKLSRVLENFSVFEACLKSQQKKKIGPSEIINYLGYSSSNVIFLIKILLLTHDTSFPFSEHVNSIVFSISEFEIKSYKNQLRNIKDVLRRLEHNNEIIAMIKTRCGKKHGKYCEEFLTRTIKEVEKEKVAFYECANSIFEFLAFYIHFENLAANFEIISTPPSPFLFLTYPRTIIIEPWGVLAFRKNNKLVIRAHCGKFLTEISNNCNLIFWTELMPKDAEILTSLLPVKDNVHWLYRYHCRQENQNLLKIVDLVGCDVKNTLIIDNNEEHFSFNPNIGVLMPWTGEKKDIKLMPLSEILQEVLVLSEKTNVEAEIVKKKGEIDKLNNKKRINHKLLKSRIS